jgi:hypothetical protein
MVIMATAICPGKFFEQGNQRHHYAKRSSMNTDSQAELRESTPSARTVVNEMMGYSRLKSTSEQWKCVS